MLVRNTEKQKKKPKMSDEEILEKLSMSLFSKRVKFQVLLCWFLRMSISWNVSLFCNPLLKTWAHSHNTKLREVVRDELEFRLSPCDTGWSLQGATDPQALQNKPWINNIYLIMKSEIVPHLILQLWSRNDYIAMLDIRCLKDGEKINASPSLPSSVSWCKVAWLFLSALTFCG